jgi:hypothetical protein
MRVLPFLLIVYCLYACSKRPAEHANTFDFLPGEKIALLDNKKIEEASGLVASISNKGMLWVHNDSGNPPEIFLIDRQTTVHMMCRLKNADNRDWEDIAMGPGPDPSKNYLYVGDIGDNYAQYKYKMIYRFEEPVLSDSTKKEVVIEKYDRIIFQLDTQKDTETLMIDPLNGDIYIISKREEPVVLYRLELQKELSDTLTAKPVLTIPLTLIVAGDFSADGKHILLKNYQNVFYWERSDKESLEQVFKRPGRILPYSEEPQGESIAFARDGSGYFTVSEKIKGEKAFLQFYKKK